MGASHGHLLHYHGHSWLHRAAAEHKLLSLVGFAVVVVTTPLAWWPLLIGWAAALLIVIATSSVPPTYLLKRLVVEIPVLVFVLLLPFLSEGEKARVLGVPMVLDAVPLAGGMLAKVTLCVLAALLFAATTEGQALLAGLQRLRVPDPLVQIAGFMLRYVSVVGSDLSRMSMALRSRGFDPRSPRHWPVLARCLGALFIRSYERGERVHHAMLSRGYTGRMPAEVVE